MGGGIYDGTYPAADPFMRAAMEEEKAVAGMSERCPKCGADRLPLAGVLGDLMIYKCGLGEQGTGVEPVQCLRNQLDQAQKRIAELERQQQSPPVYLQRIEELAEENQRMRDAIKSVLERVGDPKHLRYVDEQSVYMLWEFCRIWELLEDPPERGDGGD